MRFLIAGLLFGALVLPQVSLAKQPPPSQGGVHVDPGSPAGKQYAFPVSSARAEAAGNSGSSGGGNGSNPPLFGSGATARGGGSGDAAGGGHANSTDHSKPARKAGKKSGSSSTPDPARVAINAAAPLGSAVEPPRVGDSAWIPLTIGGVLVLVLGGGIGVAMRRRESNAGD